MKKSKLLNTSILDNTRVRIQPSLIVGESNGYKSGDILDANAVVELVKKYSGGGNDEDFTDTKKASENFFYKEINGIKYVMYRTDDGHEEFGYSGGGNYIITDDPYNFKMKYYAASYIDDAPEISDNVLFTGERGVDDGYFSYVTVPVSSDYHDGTKEITLPVEGEYISDIDNPDQVPEHSIEITDDNVNEIKNDTTYIILDTIYNESSAELSRGVIPEDLLLPSGIDNTNLITVYAPYAVTSSGLLRIPEEYVFEFFALPVNIKVRDVLITETGTLENRTRRTSVSYGDVWFQIRIIATTGSPFERNITAFETSVVPRQGQSSPALFQYELWYSNGYFVKLVEI